jgi:hypothetical protein
MTNLIPAITFAMAVAVGWVPRNPAWCISLSFYIYNSIPVLSIEWLDAPIMAKYHTNRFMVTDLQWVDNWEGPLTNTRHVNLVL